MDADESRLRAYWSGNAPRHMANPQKRMGAEVKPLWHGVADVFPEYCKEPLTDAVMSNDTANR
jgi:hypothetical protein